MIGQVQQWAAPPWPASPAASAAARRPAANAGAPHRGIRVADQGHRRRRGGVARRALRLSDFEKIAHAAVERRKSFSSAAASASGGFEVRRYGLEVGGCRDRGLHLGERVLHRRVVQVNVSARRGRRRSDGQRRSRGAAADRDGHHYQQRHAHTDRDRGGGTAERETAGGRPAHGSGESQRVLDEAQCQHGQPGGEDDRCQPAGQAQRVAQQRRCEHQHRPVPQIPRVGHPADRPHRRQCQDAAASLRRCGTAGADHQHRAEHGQQRGGTRIGRGRAQQGAGQQDQRPARPIPRSRRVVPVVGATGRP